jgi:L-ascorbate metabolism protein UlaG (beta-lactamase superfamily)
MTITYTWLGHGTAQLTLNGHTVLLDPFLTGNPAAAVKPETLNPEYILVTHGHGDHVSDLVSIGQRTGAQVISNFEIAEWCTAQGLKPTASTSVAGISGPSATSSSPRRCTARPCPMAATAATRPAF